MSGMSRLTNIFAIEDMQVSTFLRLSKTKNHICRYRTSNRKLKTSNDIHLGKVEQKVLAPSRQSRVHCHSIFPLLLSSLDWPKHLMTNSQSVWLLLLRTVYIRQRRIYEAARVTADGSLGRDSGWNRYRSCSFMLRESMHSACCLYQVIEALLGLLSVPTLERAGGSS